MEVCFTQEDFAREAQDFIMISNKIGDNWQILNKAGEIGLEYLVGYRKVNLGDELFHFEYHIVYSVSYQVPILFFNITRSDGSLLTVDDAWNIFKNSSINDQSSNLDMYKILTQMEHPHLFKPFLALHPCRTAEILSMNPNSKNRLVTFISTMGPHVQLNLDPLYGKQFD